MLDKQSSKQETGIIIQRGVKEPQKGSKEFAWLQFNETLAQNDLSTSIASVHILPHMCVTERMCVFIKMRKQAYAELKKCSYLAWIFKHGFSVRVKLLWHWSRIKPYILFANDLKIKRQRWFNIIFFFFG